ncbi:MAG: cytochrome c [Pseudomonadota bacterium]
MRGKLFLSSSVAVAAASLFAVANAATPVELQKVRHDHYHELGDAFKEVRDQSKASTPDFDALLKAAEVVNNASIDQQQWFPKGTGPEAGKTRALPEVWSKPEDFTAAQKMFSDRAPKLLAAAKTKDVAAVQAAFKELGGACKNCHDNFRSPEEH